MSGVNFLFFFRFLGDEGLGSAIGLTSRSGRAGLVSFWVCGMELLQLELEAADFKYSTVDLVCLAVRSSSGVDPVISSPTRLSGHFASRSKISIETIEGERKKRKNTNSEQQNVRT